MSKPSKHHGKPSPITVTDLCPKYIGTMQRRDLYQYIEEVEEIGSMISGIYRGKKKENKQSKREEGHEKKLVQQWESEVQG